MNLSLAETAEFYAIAGTETTVYCGVMLDRERKRNLAGAVLRAFEVEKSKRPNIDPSARTIRYAVLGDQEFGALYGSILVFILVNVLAGVIRALVEWLIKKWIEKHPAK